VLGAVLVAVAALVALVALAVVLVGAADEIEVADAPTTTIGVLVGSIVLVLPVLGLAAAGVSTAVDAEATLSAADCVETRPAR
jgi:hypothetical protein